jgi:hypothetical protein
MAQYPKPDRSDFTPNFNKTEDNDVLDFGWAEGVLSDGRPYRLECWCQDQVTSETFFISSVGLEDLDEAGVVALLEREKLVHFTSTKRYVGVKPFRDASGNALLSINIVVGDEDGTFVEGGPAINRYSNQPSFGGF